MYTPASFAIEDLALLHAFMARHSFATLVSWTPAPVLSHLPLVLISEPRPHLLGHLAAANAHGDALVEGGEALAIFQGPHAYISPGLYENPLAVPTWNYTAVHAWCTVRRRHDVDALLETTLETFAPVDLQRWRALPEAYRAEMRRGIVAFELCIVRLEGKFKLSQNRPPADQQRIIDALSNSADADAKGVAALMRQLRIP